MLQSAHGASLSLMMARACSSCLNNIKHGHELQARAIIINNSQLPNTTALHKLSK
jgi:hypothetical protein